MVSSVLARSTRARICHLCGGTPVDALKAEQKWEADSPVRSASSCRRIVWLNPMIGWEDYAPEAAGMKAALPHVDLFAPAHDLKSLAALEPYLARL